MFNDFLSNNFSIYILKLRSTNKNFHNFNLFLSSLNFTLGLICFSETWLDDSIFTSTLLYKLSNYLSRDQVINNHNVVGISIYIHKSLTFKITKI